MTVRLVPVTGWGNKLRARVGLRGNRAWVMALFVVALAFWALVGPLGACASVPPLLRHFCETGSAAGQCSNGQGMAVDPASGNVYISNGENHRVDEFTAYGSFIRAWGWGVIDGSPELQTCTEQSGCRAGLSGPGNGEFGVGSPRALAIDSTGAVYVSTLAIVGFRSSTPAAPKSISRLLSAARDRPGQFSEATSGRMAVVQGSPEAVYVSDNERIQEFKTNGEYLGNLPDPEGLLAGNSVLALAADSVGSVYFSRTSPRVAGNAGDDVFKLNAATGSRACTMKVPRASAIATTAAGRVWVVSNKHEVGRGTAGR